MSKIVRVKTVARIPEHPVFGTDIGPCCLECCQKGPVESRIWMYWQREYVDGDGIEVVARCMICHAEEWFVVQERLATATAIREAHVIACQWEAA